MHLLLYMAPVLRPSVPAERTAMPGPPVDGEPNGYSKFRPAGARTSQAVTDERFENRGWKLPSCSGAGTMTEILKQRWCAETDVLWVKTKRNAAA